MLTTIIILFGIFTGICAFISATHKTLDPSKRGLKKITSAGFWFIAFALILIALPAIQNYISDKIQKTEQDKRDEKQKKDFNASILEIKKEFDKSSKTSTATITDILGKYGYKVDSLNMVLESLNNDENKGKSTPVFTICPSPCKGIELMDSLNDHYKLKITFSSQDEGSSKFNVKIQYAIEDYSGNIRSIPDKNVTLPTFPYTTKLSKGATASYNIAFNVDADISIFYVWVKGTYKRTDGSGDFPVNDLFTFHRIGNYTHVVSKPQLIKRITRLMEQD